jgi:hypothetical protein
MLPGHAAHSQNPSPAKSLPQRLFTRSLLVTAPCLARQTSCRYSASPRPSACTLAITLDRQPAALLSTRINPRRAVRRGASWTAAYHRQLTVAAVASPIRSSVGVLDVLAVERSWSLLAQTTSARRSLQPVSRRSGVVAVVDTASRHATASVAAVQQAVSTHPVSASGIRLSSRPASGHLGSSSSGSGARPSAVHPSGVQPSAVHPCGVQLSGVQPSGVCPVRPDASVSSHAQAVASGTQVEAVGRP